MAWEYVTISALLNNSTCNDAHLTAAGKFTSGTLPDDFTREPIYKIDWETAFPVNTFMTGDANLGLKYTGTNIELWKNNSAQGLISMRWNWSDGASHNNIIFIAAIDRDREVGTFLVYKRYYGLEDGAWDAPPYTNTYLENQDNMLIETNDCYNAILALVPVLYQWTSVPAISGKNGILSLPTLVDTDGNPISGQSASVFSSLPEGSNVRALINGAL